MLKIIVAGSRTFDDYSFLKEKLDHLLKNQEQITIISGTANGADKLGERYAKERNLPLLRFPANWDKYGKRAGYLRNEEMAKNANACVVFWDGKSRGAQHMINLAKTYKLQLRVIKY